MMGQGPGFGTPGLGVTLVWVLIIVVVLVRAAALGGYRAAGKTAGQLPDERFARGEIGRQEYEEKRRLLEQ